MRYVVTGAAGFLGWHTRARLALTGADVTALTRQDWTPAALDAAVGALTPQDAVLHLAGINRGPEADLEAGNVALADDLVAALTRTGAGPTVVVAGSNYADDDHPGRDTPYGRGKRGAGAALRAWGERVGARVVELRFPGLFGEHGRPDYNSFVATFAHRIATGGQPSVVGERELPLIHAQDAVATLLRAAGDDAPLDPVVALPELDIPHSCVQMVARPQGRPVAISAVAARLRDLHDCYAPAGDIPALGDALDVALFNTLRAAMWDAGARGFAPTAHRDPRGELLETIRVHGGGGQSFVSTTRPGHVRGNHLHLHKIERFAVVAGRGLIRLRRLLDDRVVELPVSGEEPRIIDMPTLWAHSIENVGDTGLVTFFWADELFDPARPDTYPMPVRPQERPADLAAGADPEPGTDPDTGTGPGPDPT